MKKVRMTVQKDSVGKKFQIFNSPESLYVWLNDKDLQEIDELDPTLGTTIFLQSGETMEVEWMGCEFIVENKEWGSFVVLSTDSQGDELHGKYMRILGETLCKVESFSRNNGVI